MKNLREILFNQNEKIVATLGNGVIRKFLTTGILGNGLRYCPIKDFISEVNAFIRRANFTEQTQKKSLSI